MRDKIARQGKEGKRGKEGTKESRKDGELNEKIEIKER
jgi:hypothetical protein